MPDKVVPIAGFTDPFSSITHLSASLVFLVLLYFLLRRTARGHRFAVFVFGFACVFQLAISGSYHLLDPGAGRNVLQRIDHAAIFFLIAASFTPIHSILFRGLSRWGVLLLVWSTAITGITLKTIFFTSIPEWLGLIFFLGLGWIGVLSAIMLCRRFGVAYNRLLFLSGLSYTAGATLEFLHAPVIVARVIGPHELFHIAVILGISFHWIYVHGFASGKVYANTARQYELPGI